MHYYIALIHNDTDSCCGVSFPDMPGVFTAGDTNDEPMQRRPRFFSLLPRTGPTQSVANFRHPARSMNCAQTRNFRNSPGTR
jgi:hypothetical protein